MLTLVLLSWFWMFGLSQRLDYDSWADQAVLSDGLCRHGNSVECCRGWRQTDWGRCQREDTITPHCQQGCKHGECVGPDRCKCHPGYTGKACNQDVNECGVKPRPCKHRCMNTPGSFKCYCPDGFVLLPDGSCRNARTCYHANCQYGCQVVKGEVRCTCPSPGLRLGPDRRTCVDIDECESGGGVCPRRRKCVNTFGSFICKCHLGFRLMYINGRYTCIDKDPRPFCALNPSSPKCRCKDGSCKVIPKVTVEPQRPRTTTTAATTTFPATTTTTASPTTTTIISVTITAVATTSLAPSTNPTTTTTTTTTPVPKTTTPTTTTAATTTTSTTTITTTSLPTTTPEDTTTPATTPEDTTTPATTPEDTTTPAMTPEDTTTPATTPEDTTTPATTPEDTTTPATTPEDTTTPATTPEDTTTPATTPEDTTTPATTPEDTTTPATTPEDTTTPATTPEDTTTLPPPTTPATTTVTTTTTTTDAATPSPAALTTTSMVTTTVNNRINKDVTHRQRGDVHIPRQPDQNQVWEFDIELGNTADDARDDPGVGGLHCAFDHGVCDWISDRDGDLNWETVRTPSGERYLSVPELKAGQRSIRGARLAVQIVAPWSHGDLCFSFSHWLTGHHVGVLQLFVRKTGRDQRYGPAIWSRTGGHGWRQTQVTLTTHSVDKVLLKVERRKGRRGQIAVDDVTLRQGPQQNIYCFYCFDILTEAPPVVCRLEQAPPPPPCTGG